MHKRSVITRVTSQCQAENMDLEDEIMLTNKRLTVELDSLGTEQSTTHWPRNERSRWLAVLFVGTACLYMTRIIMPLCVVAIAKDMAWDKRQSGLVLSTFFWGYFLTQVPGGFLSDVYGPKRLLLWAIAGCSISTIAVPLLTTKTVGVYVASPILLVIISRICLGFSQGIYFPTLYSLLAKALPLNDRSSCSATALSGGPVGSLLMGAFGSVVLSRYGWQWVFLLFGSAGLVWVFVWMKHFMDDNSTEVTKHKEKRTAIKISKPLNGIKKETQLIVPWGKIIKEPAIWAIVITHFCHNCMYFNLISWLPTYFHENFPQAQGWVFNVLPYACNFAGKIIGGVIADRMIKLGCSISFTRKLLESFGTLVASLVLLGTTYTTVFWQALFCMSLALGLAGLSTSGALCNIQDLSPGFAGSISGITFSIGSIPGIFGVYMTGYILHATNSWRVVFQLTVAICTVGCAVYNILGKGERVL